jgi:hypothetical protein
MVTRNQDQMHYVTCAGSHSLPNKNFYMRGVKWCAPAAGGGSPKQAKRKKARSPPESGSMAASVLLAGQNTLIKQDGKMINDTGRELFLTQVKTSRAPLYLSFPGAINLDWQTAGSFCMLAAGRDQFRILRGDELRRHKFSAHAFAHLQLGIFHHSPRTRTHLGRLQFLTN